MNSGAVGIVVFSSVYRLEAEAGRNEAGCPRSPAESPYASSLHVPGFGFLVCLCGSVIGVRVSWLNDQRRQHMDVSMTLPALFAF